MHRDGEQTLTYMYVYTYIYVCHVHIYIYVCMYVCIAIKNRHLHIHYLFVYFVLSFDPHIPWRKIKTYIRVIRMCVQISVRYLIGTVTVRYLTENKNLRMHDQNVCTDLSSLICIVLPFSQKLRANFRFFNSFPVVNWYIRMMGMCVRSQTDPSAALFSVHIHVNIGMHTYIHTCMVYIHTWIHHGILHMYCQSTAILIIIEGHETAFNGFWYQFTTGKLLKNLKLTLNYYENGSM